MLGAVVNFARYTADFPSFDRQLSVHRQLYNHHSPHSPRTKLNDSLVEVVSPDRVPGEVLPRSETTWIVLAPFQDMNKRSRSRETKTKIVRARRAFLELLARLAESPRFRWRATQMHCGETIGLDPINNRDCAFWIDLLRALSPSAASDDRQPLERGLIALTRARRPRFLLCFNHGVSSLGLPRLLELFLLPRDENDEPVQINKTIMDELKDLDATKPIEVEIGLSFTVGPIPWAILAQILGIIDRCHASRDVDGVRFLVTTLRFGRNCTLEAKSIERLGQRFPSSIQCLRLGNLSHALEPSKRALFAGLARGAASLRRIRLDSSDGFVPLAAALRSGSLPHVWELDVQRSSDCEHAVWLAFALFHVDSQSSVTSLCMRSPRGGDLGDLTDEWLETFIRVLQGVSASGDLADINEDDGEDGGPGRQLKLGSTSKLITFVRLQPGVVARIASTKSSKKLCTLDSSDLEDFEQLARQGESLAIVVPGVGVGWVPLASVVSERTERSRLPAAGKEIPTNRRIKSFKLDRPVSELSSRGFDRLMRLLSIIGKPLRCLHLPALRLRSKHLAEILDRCPNLTELNVSGHDLEDMQPLVDAYARDQCQIAALSIARSMFTRTDYGDLTRSMATILQGSGGHILRRLVVHALPPREYDQDRYATTDVWRHGVVPLAQVASASLQFEYLHLPGLDLFGNRARLWLCVDFRSQPLCLLPTAPDAKLAFISVVHRHEQTSSLGQLDARMLSIVFGFSSETVVRRVLQKGRMLMDPCECCYREK